MTKALRVLLLEDSEFDAQLLLSLLRKGGYDPHWVRVETADQFASSLRDSTWDVILADYNLPQFSAPAALAILQQTGLDIPFVIVSGGIGENTAVAAMKAGAHDYLMKGNLARLVPAVERELREADNRAGKRRTADALRQSELRYRLLWETATDAVMLIDTQGTIQFANPAVEKVFGYNPNELIGRHVSILQPDVEEDHSIERHLRNGGVTTGWDATESIATHKDGRELPIEMAFSEMELEGKPWFVCFIRDITARKKTEQTLLENQEQFRVARDIQQHLFPKTPPRLPGFDIAGHSLPAEATGGDYFDFLPMRDNCVGLVVGDVTGHGVGPALLMAETRAYLRILARGFSEPGEILTQANMVLAQDVGAERFITLSMVKLDPTKRHICYINAGHSPGYIFNAHGDVKLLLKRTGPPLGIKSDTTFDTSEAIQVETGDIILLLTDGFEEAVSPTDEFFGTDRILQIVKENSAKSAQEIVEALYEAIDQFTAEEPQADDLTVLVAKAVGAPKT